MSRQFHRRICGSSDEVEAASLAQMLSTLGALWEALRDDGREAMGEAGFHHHLLLEVMDVSWPHVDRANPAYWCLLDCEDEDHAMDALAWTNANGADHNYGFMAVHIGPTDLDLRVIFATTDETESVIFKTGFG